MENSKLLTILVEVDEGTKSPFKAYNEILSLVGFLKPLTKKRPKTTSTIYQKTEK